MVYCAEQAYYPRPPPPQPAYPAPQPAYPTYAAEAPQYGQLGCCRSNYPGNLLLN